MQEPRTPSNQELLRDGQPQRLQVARKGRTELPGEPSWSSTRIVPALCLCLVSRPGPDLWSQLAVSVDQTPLVVDRQLPREPSQPAEQEQGQALGRASNWPG